MIFIYTRKRIIFFGLTTRLIENDIEKNFYKIAWPIHYTELSLIPLFYFFSLNDDSLPTLPQTLYPPFNN